MDLSALGYAECAKRESTRDKAYVDEGTNVCVVETLQVVVSREFL